jgi:hypothetical protein
MTTDPQFPATVVGHITLDESGYRAFFGDEVLDTLSTNVTATQVLAWRERQCLTISARLAGRTVMLARDLFWAFTL